MMKGKVILARAEHDAPLMVLVSPCWRRLSLKRLCKMTFLIGVLIGVVCYSPQAIGQSADAASQEEVALQLKWCHGFQFAGYYAAQEKGYYREEGLDVAISEASPSHLALDAVLSGDAEYGVWDGALLNERLSGKPVVVLAVIFQHSPYIVLSRKDAGISVPSDLIGRRVMIEDGYSDFEELKFSGLEVYGVPGLWCREYNDWHIPNLIIEEIEGVTIAAAHSETSLNHKARAADIVLTGHTHHASMAEAGRAIYLNPGHLKNISSRGVYASFASIAIDGDKIRVTIHEMTGDPRQTEEFSLQTR